MKRIYLVRHGKTFINKYNKMQGWCDTPLTDEGREGAEKAAEALQDLPLDIALSSNTLRASETCEIIMERPATGTCSSTWPTLTSESTFTATLRGWTMTWPGGWSARPMAFLTPLIWRKTRLATRSLTGPRKLTPTMTLKTARNFGPAGRKVLT